MIILGFGLDTCQGFPVCASIAACHAPFPHSRSSNRACGFPAHGSPTGFIRQHTTVLSRTGRDSENVTIFADK